MDLGGWLRGLGLERYEAAFRENEISEKVLPSLTAEDLKELGVAALGYRRMLSTPLRRCALTPARKRYQPRQPLLLQHQPPQRPIRAALVSRLPHSVPAVCLVADW